MSFNPQLANQQQQIATPANRQTQLKNEFGLSDESEGSDDDRRRSRANSDVDDSAVQNLMQQVQSLTREKLDLMSRLSSAEKNNAEQADMNRNAKQLLQKRFQSELRALQSTVEELKEQVIDDENQIELLTQQLEQARNPETGYEVGEQKGV